MSGLHARLSPSAAERWATCPGSVRLAEQLTETGYREDENKYAMEGTIAHTLGELRARKALLNMPPEDYSKSYSAWVKVCQANGITDEQQDEMLIHTRAYVKLLEERMARHPHSMLMLEQRVPTGVPSCWGTADAVIVSPVHVEVIDLKYGAGVRVSSIDNPQLKLYGVGALEQFGDVLGTVDDVYWTVFQPRMDNICTESVSADELRRWRDKLIPIAELALTDNAPLNPTAEACRWCPAAGDCVARMEKSVAEDFGTGADLLTDDEIAAVLQRIPDIKSWCTAVEEAAFRRAYNEEKHLPGWKVVLSGGQRSIPDHDAAIKALIKAGYSEDDVARRSIQTLGHLEKLLGKEVLPEVLGSLLKPPQGRPSLVPDTDNRPAISGLTQAAEDFK